MRNVFDHQTEYAVLDYMDSIRLIDYEADSEDETERLSGTMEVTADMTGYVCWDREDIDMGSGLIHMEMMFYFLVEDGTYSDLESEYLFLYRKERPIR